MDPTAVAAQQPTIWLEAWLNKYAPAIQTFGFLGWWLVGIAALAFAIAFIVLVPAARRAANEYCRWVEAQIGPAKMEEAPEDKGAEKVDVDKFVE